MTGQKNRFSTTEKLWDLDDKQLKTPKHDAMVLWLMNEDNLKNMFEIKGELDNGRRLYKTFVKTEVPIYSNKNFIGGYADLIYYGVYRDWIDNDWGIYSNKDCVKVIEVKPYIDSFGAVLRQINSYKDMIEDGYYSSYNTGSSKLNKFFNCEYCLFTLDQRFDAQFKSQDITVLHPPKDVSIDDMVELYGLE